jgi:uncharacterized repeat protein (TIGR01451 family)
MIHRRLFWRVLTLLGLVFGVLILTMGMITLVQAQGDASITIEKEADQEVTSGPTATFTIVITNTGDITLTSVTVADPLVGDCNRVFGSLQAGWGRSYTCTAWSVVNSFTNTASVSGTLEGGGIVTDTDTAAVTVIHPDIEIDKTVAPTVVNIGDAVHYTITVENTGDSDLGSVSVDEDLPGCTLSGPDGDSQNPGVLDVDEVWEYTCSVTAGSEDIVNTAIVNATDEAGGTVSHSGTATVTVIHPAVEFAKMADPTAVRVGDAVHYTITVENTGDSDLANVAVDDGMVGCTLTGPVGDDGDLTLATDETWTYTCTVTAGNEDIVNTAVFIATDEAGGTVAASAQAEADVIKPDIEIAKTPDVQTVARLSNVTFNIAITNTGDVTLTAVTVSDAQASDCVRGSGELPDLAPRESTSYACTLYAVPDGLINSATVAALPPAGAAVTDTDAAKVILDETQPCPLDMVAYWRLDEDGATTYDDFYDGHDGVCAGDCPTPSTGRVNGGQAFDGSDTGIDVLLVPGDDSFNWGSQDSFSIEFWMQADSPGACSGNNEVIVGREDSSTSLHWWVGCWEGGAAAFYLRDRAGAYAKLEGDTNLVGGVWHHIVAVRDASTNQILLYVDGILEDAATQVYSGFDSTSAALNIGWLNRSHGYHFEGTADEIAVYDRALSASEIWQHRNEGMAERWYCAAGPFPPKIVSTPVTEAMVGRLYTYDVEAVAEPEATYALLVRPSGMNISPATGLITWTPGLGQEGSKAVVVEASNSEGVYTQPFTLEVIPGTICPTDMIAYWRLDEDGVTTYSDFYDGHHGECAGSCPSPSAGRINGGQAFDGSNTGINVPAHTAFDWGASDSFSIEFWMQTDSPDACSDNNEVIVGREDDSTLLHWWVGCWRGGDATVYLRDRIGSTVMVTGTTDLTDGAWHHVVAVREASTGPSAVLIYVDGREEGAATQALDGFDSSIAVLNIGWLDRSHGYHFEGTLDEVAVYDRALSASEIRQHYDEGDVGPGYCINPGIAVEKTASPMVAYLGDKVTYTYALTNLGDAPLTVASPSDDKCSPMIFVGGDDGSGQLDPVETWTYQCSMYPSADITNTVTVSGSHSLVGSVNSTDVVSVEVIDPEIAIAKRADPTSIYAGDTVTYTYTVANPGDDPLSSVHVSDDKCDAVNLVGGDDNDNYDLDPGEVWTYTCSTVLNSDTLNIATAAGIDSAGGIVSATDTVFVNVVDDLTLTIVKEADEDDTVFDFTVTYGITSTLFHLKNGERRQFPGLMPDRYTITETVAPAWELLSITCTNGISLTSPERPGVTVDLQAGQDASCTFTNRRLPYIFLPIVLRHHLGN